MLVLALGLGLGLTMVLLGSLAPDGARVPRTSAPGNQRSVGRLLQHLGPPRLTDGGTGLVSALKGAS